MAETLYLKISFLGFNDCFLKIFRFFRSLTPPFFLKKRAFNTQTHN
ncbi:hypothetical protein L933_01745 [Helicobacter pylori PZ5056]|uniref:Uncharacterized protein n=1 Tax=Helicobacter pylori PZ5056 TaxID=1337393 RepID=T2T4W7_HELPX|nr:hypothetical protein L933_01745 [Helicobacter pylori PZ5056]